MDTHLVPMVEEIESESASLDFKAGFDVQSQRDWCEVIKDLAAMANSGGGRIVFGVNDDGTPSGSDLGPLRDLDPATITDKLARYIGQQFSDFRLVERKRGDQPVLALEVAAAPIPLVFTAPGTYEVPGGGKQQQRTAFAKGTVYFRHGAKSEPAISADIRAVVEREVERQRSSWLEGIRKVVEAPAGSIVSVMPPQAQIDPLHGTTLVRLTHEASAPALKAPDFDALYPYRQKEVLGRLAVLLPGAKLNSHDVLCIRKHHGLDDDPTYSSKHRFGSRQYSEALVDWIVSSYMADPEFFHRAREAMKHAAADSGAS